MSLWGTVSLIHIGKYAHLPLAIFRPLWVKLLHTLAVDHVLTLAGNNV